MPVPDGLHVPNNCVVVSAEGWGILRMAGGDYDGDLAMLVFCSITLSLYRSIAPAIQGYPLRPIQKATQEELGERVDLYFRPGCARTRLMEYLQFGQKLRNKELRGTTTAFAERVAHQFLQRPDEDRVTRLENAMKAGICTHAATDFPKHFSLEQVTGVVNTLKDSTGVKRSHQRSTEVMDGFLRSIPNTYKRKEMMEDVSEHLVAALGGGSFGRYWLAEKLYILDFAAGRRIANILLTQPFGTPYFERSGGYTSRQHQRQ